MSISETKAAFDLFRAKFQAKELDPARVKNEDEVIQITSENGGLKNWVDGPVRANVAAPRPPLLSTTDLSSKCLWAVRPDDVVYALENTDYSASLQTGCIKHSNLTGGAPAHCAGEIVKIEADTIVVNGSSGRYGPRSEEEMAAVAKAFRLSGYKTWSMGYDPETKKPFPFLGVTPSWVQA